MGPGVLEATKVNNQELVQWLVSNNLTDLLSALGKRSQGLLKKISDSQAAQVKAQEVKQAQAAEQVKAQKIEARRVEVRQGLRAILASYRYNQDEAYERDLDAQVNALNLTADDLGLIDENGWNALMWLLNGTLNTVQLGFTPSFNPRIELARKLIGKMHPKDLAQVDKSGKTALTLAIKNKREEIAAEIAKEMLYRDLNSSYRNLAQTEGFNHLDEVLRERITDNAINLASLDDSRAYRP
jgi:ankyrin repeat protein